MWVSVDQRSDYVIWSPPDGSVIVRLAHTLIDRLNIEVMRGYGVTRRRGTEIGGILIGRVEPGAPDNIYLDDFYPVPCEYAFGPSYHLSPNDEEEFREAAERWRAQPGKPAQAVGLFRSHTRDEGMSPDAQDAVLFSRYFGKGTAVVLLIKPYVTRPCRASFFVPVDGVLPTETGADDFNFVAAASEERSGAPAARAYPPPSKVAIPQEPPPIAGPLPLGPTPAEPAMTPPANERIAAVSAPMPVRRPSEVERVLADVLGPRRSIVLDHHPGDRLTDPPRFGSYGNRPATRWRRALAWVSFTLAAIALGGVAGFQYAGGRVPPIVVQSAKPLPPPDPYAVNLGVERQGMGLLVRWNVEAPVILEAQSGVLVISEKRASKEVPLGRSELQTGTVIYQRAAPEVKFRLELFLRDNRSLVETVTWRSPIDTAERNRARTAKPKARSTRS